MRSMINHDLASRSCSWVDLIKVLKGRYCDKVGEKILSNTQLFFNYVVVIMKLAYIFTL